MNKRGKAALDAVYAGEPEWERSPTGRPIRKFLPPAGRSSENVVRLSPPVPRKAPAHKAACPHCGEAISVRLFRRC